MEEIKRIFSEAPYREPVASIFEILASGSLPVSGNETKRELRALAKAYVRNAPKGQERFGIAADERTRYMSIHLREIDGITFVLGCGLGRMLRDRDLRLTFDGARFLFIGPDNTRYTTFESLERRGAPR